MLRLGVRKAVLLLLSGAKESEVANGVLRNTVGLRDVIDECAEDPVWVLLRRGLAWVNRDWRMMNDELGPCPASIKESGNVIHIAHKLAQALLYICASS